jgi:hypothetical protein
MCKTPEVPKSGVHPDLIKRNTCQRLACSGIRHSGEMECVDAKTPEVPKSRVNPDRSSKGDMCQSEDQRVRHSGNWSVQV